MPRTWYRWIGLLVFALVISACGSAPATVATPDAAATTAASPALSTSPAATTATPELTATETASETATAAVSATDATGTEITLAATPERLLSLSPNNTELLFALGLGRNVVAVDDFSDYPPEATELPRIGGQQAKYNVEQIVALQPDLVLAAGITPPETIEQLRGLGLTVAVVSVEETSFATFNDEIRMVAALTGADQQGETLIADIQQQIDAVKTRVATAETRPRVYWELDASDPAKPFTVGPQTFINDMIDLAGGVNIFADAESPYFQTGLEQIAAADPEVILLADADYGITVDSVLSRPGWSEISAVREKQVYPLESNLVSRLGPRIGQGLEQVARQIHPELFD